MLFKSVIPADAKVADVIRNDPERDCRKYNIKARAREIFTALDVDKNGMVSFRIHTLYCSTLTPIYIMSNISYF